MRKTLPLHRKLIICGSLILTCSSLPVQAKEELVKVEILAFQQSNDLARKEEAWPKHPGLPNMTDGIPFRELREHYETIATELEGHPDSLVNLEELATLEPPRPSEPPPYQLLPPSHWDLKRIEYALNNSKQYAPLLHTAWKQSIDSRSNLPPILYQSSVQEDLTQEESEAFAKYAPKTKLTLPEFEGRIKIKQSKYIHLDLDFVYREPNEAINISQENDQFSTDEIYQYEEYFAGKNWFEVEPYMDQKESVTHYNTYRLQKSLRIKYNRLYYIDHPIFAFLVKITPIQEESAS